MNPVKSVIVGLLSKSRPVEDVLHGTPGRSSAAPRADPRARRRVALGRVLDLLPGNERAAQLLVGTGLLAAAPTVATGEADWSRLHEQQMRVGVVHAAMNTDRHRPLHRLVAGAAAREPGPRQAARLRGHHRDQRGRLPRRPPQLPSGGGREPHRGRAAPLPLRLAAARAARRAARAHADPPRRRRPAAARPPGRRPGGRDLERLQPPLGAAERGRAEHRRRGRRVRHLPLAPERVRAPQRRGRARTRPTAPQPAFETRVTGDLWRCCCRTRAEAWIEASKESLQRILR